MEGPVRSRKIFDAADVGVGALSALLGFVVYFFTAAPSVTLLDSGEFLTAGQQFGVPHPTGYPLWTVLAWIFHLLPLGNDAWEINLLSGVLGALAVGLCAVLVRSSLRWLFPVQGTGWLATVVSLSAALLFAFSVSMWSQAVITEIYTLHALLVGCVLLATYGWIRRPQRLIRLLAVFFFLSLAFSNHQLTLSLAPLPFLAVLMVRRRMLLDLLAASLVTLEIFYLALAVLSQDPLVLKAAMRLFYVLAVAIAVFVLVKKNRVRWCLIALLPAAVALGLLPYAYLPFASSTNPPMNWGYTRDVKGFFYSFNRSQYSGSLTSQSLRILGPLLGVPQQKAPDPPAPPPPQATPLQTKELSFLQRVGDWSGFFLIQLATSFTPLGILALLGALLAAIRAREQRLAWLAQLLTAFALAALLQPLLDKAETDANGWWLQMPYHTYTNLIFGLLVGTGGFYLLVPVFVRSLALRRGIFALLFLPIVPLFLNAGQAGQRGRWFGWQYGHDMLKDLPEGSVVIGGTDAGRFVPTYMIFGESTQPTSRKRDPDFDRRDLYIITQNALGDPFYMEYLRDQYSADRPAVKNAFERWLGRETIYPDKPLVLPSARDAARAIVAANTPDPVTGKRLEAADSIRPFSAVLHWIWNQNRGSHDFFVEESFPLEWTYDYAIPHGLVYQLNKTKLERIPEEAVKRDLAFWTAYKNRLLGDKNFLADFDARRSFSKLRTTGGNIYRHRQMWPEAEQAYREALELWPGEGSALYALMLLNWNRGEFDECLGHIERAAREDPRNRTWPLLREYARQRKVIQEEIQLLKAHLRQQPADFAAIERLVALYTQVSQSQKALDLLDNSRLLLQQRPEFLRFAAGYDQSHGRGELALASARQLVQIEPNLPENHYVLARALYFQKDLPGFYAAAAEAIAIGGLPMRSFILQDPSFAPLRQELPFKKLTMPEVMETH